LQTVKTWGITDKRREIPIKNEFERQTYSNFNKELRQVFLAITRVSAEKVFQYNLK
jgi:hypothetical protein